MMPKKVVLVEEEELDEGLLKIIRGTVQKRAAALVSYGNFIMRDLSRRGIHCNIYTSTNMLADGIRVVVEFRVLSVDKSLAQRLRRSMYHSAFDYTPAGGVRRIDRLIKELEQVAEGEGEEVVASVSGDQATGSG